MVTATTAQGCGEGSASRDLRAAHREGHLAQRQPSVLVAGILQMDVAHSPDTESQWDSKGHRSHPDLAWEVARVLPVGTSGEAYFRPVKLL